MPELEWKAPAVADLMAIVDYISDDNPDAALALMEEIQSKVAQLRPTARPGCYISVSSQVRKMARPTPMV